MTTMPDYITPETRGVDAALCDLRIGSLEMSFPGSDHIGWYRRLAHLSRQVAQITPAHVEALHAAIDMMDGRHSRQGDLSGLWEIIDAMRRGPDQ